MHFKVVLITQVKKKQSKLLYLPRYSGTHVLKKVDTSISSLVFPKLPNILNICNPTLLIKMPVDIKDKVDQPIDQGDEVWTKARGGKHEGIVDKVATTEGGAEKSALKNPPKVASAMTKNPEYILIRRRCCSRTSMATGWRIIQAPCSILMDNRDGIF